MGMSRYLKYKRRVKGAVRQTPYNVRVGLRKLPIYNMTLILVFSFKYFFAYTPNCLPIVKVDLLILYTYLSLLIDLMMPTLTEYLGPHVRA